MNKLKKIIVPVFAIFMIVLIFGNVNATYNTPIDPSGGDNNRLEEIVGGVDKVWASVILIVQVISVGCVVFAGVRYMYASADQKADLKKGLMALAIGAILVFATSTVIRFVMNVGNEIIQ